MKPPGWPSHADMLRAMLCLFVSASCVNGVLSSTKDPLTQLALKYGTDKATHKYTPLYHRTFEAMRTSVKRFMEIGVFRGASIRMWTDYFTEAEIIGVDYYEAREKHKRWKQKNA